MGPEPIPAAEVDITDQIVADLVRSQHPDLAHLRVSRFAEGWDNTLFRLGERYLVRVPRRSAAADLVDNEIRWLHRIAPRLTVPIPVPVRVGRPDAGRGLPWRWTIVDWVPGTPLADVLAADMPATERIEVANDLARVLGELHRPAAAGAPANPYRGGPLADRDVITRERLGDLRGGLQAAGLDPGQIERVWAGAVAEPPWSGPALWLHGDLHPLNVIVRGGRVAALIDWGDMTAGDPATDLAIAWMALSAHARNRFRSNTPLAIDDSTWKRGRGWALSLALAYLAHSLDHPGMAGIGVSTLREVSGSDG